MLGLGWLLACDPEPPVSDDVADLAATPAAEVARFAGCAARLERSDSTGIPYEAEERHYDGWGWLAEVGYDYDLDGVLAPREGWSRDLWGHVLEAFVIDGDQRWVTQRGTYDPDGNPVRIEWDEQGDGIVDTVREFESDGGLTREGTTDVDADGTVDETFVYSYDALDRLVAIATTPVTDLGLSIDEQRSWDGDSDRIVHWSFVATDEGTVLLDWTYRWTWDARDRLVAASRDEDGALTDVVYAFDGDAPSPSTETETTDDMVIVTTYGYDDAWRVVTRDVSWEHLGEMHEVTAWDCP